MKKILIAVACFVSLSAFGQEETESKVQNIDWKENAEDMTTVDDIVRERQEVANRAVREQHMKKVWSNHGYFLLSWHLKADMNPVETLNGEEHDNWKTQGIETGLGKAPLYKRDWGASLIAGKNIKLHKPIANVVQFNLDFTGADVRADHYKVDTIPGTKFAYDSNQMFTPYNDDGKPKKDIYYSHWNVEKYVLSYGMNLGPSITIAPFSRLYGAKGLHYMKFNFYYHIGYRASVMIQRGDSKLDKQYATLPDKTDSSYDGKLEKLNEKNPTQWLIGHGLYQSWGISMVWKRIGIGYEHSWDKGLKYRNMGKKAYFGNKDIQYKFDTTTNRIYLSYRFGK